jgi:hypothetical protein
MRSGRFRTALLAGLAGKGPSPFKNFENLILRSRFVGNGVSKDEVFKEKSSILRDGAARPSG